MDKEYVRSCLKLLESALGLARVGVNENQNEEYWKNVLSMLEANVGMLRKGVNQIKSTDKDSKENKNGRV